MEKRFHHVIIIFDLIILIIFNIIIVYSFNQLTEPEIYDLGSGYKFNRTYRILTDGDIYTTDAEVTNIAYDNRYILVEVNWAGRDIVAVGNDEYHDMWVEREYSLNPKRPQNPRGYYYFLIDKSTGRHYGYYTYTNFIKILKERDISLRLKYDSCFS